MKLKKLFSFNVLGGVITSVSVLARPPHKPDLVTDGNVWWFEAYNDTSPTHDPNELRLLCFEPMTPPLETHSRYEWMDIFSNIFNYKVYGIAHQERDQVWMRGNGSHNTSPSGREILWSDSMQWEVVTESRPKTYTEGYGHWQGWSPYPTEKVRHKSFPSL